MKLLRHAAWHTSVVASLLLSLTLSMSALAQMAIRVGVPSGQLYDATAHNLPRGDESLILYDSSYGPSTRTNPYGVEVIAIPTGQKSSNGLMYQVQQVTSIWDCQQKHDLSGCGDAKIPPNGIVLSATGSKRDLLKAVKPGELLTLQEEWARQATTNVSLIDPTPENNPLASGFPGYRGSNQLLVYDLGYGHLTTGTNEFGFEVTVRNGLVTEQEGSDSTIPADGYVLSGHGRGRSWLLTNAPLGAKISLDTLNKTVTSTIDYDTYLYQFDHRWADSPCKSLTSDEPCRQINAKRAEAVHLNQDGKPELAITTLQNALEDLNRRIWQSYSSFPATTVRGIWHRPVETNAAAIGQTLDRLQEAGLNNVFLETFFHGYTIFPSQTYVSYGLPAQNPKFANTDILKAWVDEAHKRGMKVHIWFQTFYGGTRAFVPPGPILTKYPQWANIQFSALSPEAMPVPMAANNAHSSLSKGPGKAVVVTTDQLATCVAPPKPKLLAPKMPIPSTLENGGYFLDPANPEVQDFLFKLVDEIATRYNVDGFQLDYIRYPASFPPDRFSYHKTTWGYTDVARKIFKGTFGVDPTEIDPQNPQDASLWQAWKDFKVAQVNSFVERVSTMMHQKHPSVKVSGAVFPDANAALNQKSQDWQSWAPKGWIDFFAPMTLTSSLKVIDRDVRYMVNVVGSKIPVYAGLFGPFNDNPAELTLAQIDTAKKAGASGYVLFDTAHLTRRTLEALKIAQTPKVIPATVVPTPVELPKEPKKHHWWKWWHK